MSVDIRNLFRRRRAPLDERLPDGRSVDDLLRVAQSSADVNSGQGGGPLAQQPVAPPAVRPRSVMDTVKAAVSQPQPQVAAPVAPDTQLRNDSPTATRDRRTQPRDYIADDEAALRQAESQRDPFWKRAVIAGINAAQAGFGQQVTPIQTGRMRDIEKLQGQLGREVKMGQVQSEIAGQDALRRQRELEPVFQAQKMEQERQIQDARLEIERKRMEGELTRQEADREQRKLDRQSREKIAADRVTSQEKIAGMRPSGDDTRQAKSAAAKDEYDQLIRDEAEAGRQKNAAYDALATFRTQNPNSPDIAQMEGEAERLNKIYQSYADKKTDAQRRMRENQVDATAQSSVVDPLKGQKWYKSRYKGSRSVEDAAKEAARRGAIVLP